MGAGARTQAVPVARTGVFAPGEGLATRCLLLAHHGTAGAERAAELAFSLATSGVTRIVHLYVVPDFWDGMQGDDWLNNAWTRDSFARHVEGQLGDEAARNLRDMDERCAALGLEYLSLLRYGDPAQCLLDAVREQGADLAVIGPPRPKGELGLRSRMELEKLVRGLAVPLLVAPA